MKMLNGKLVSDSILEMRRAENTSWGQHGEERRGWRLKAVVTGIWYCSHAFMSTNRNALEHTAHPQLPHMNPGLPKSSCRPRIVSLSTRILTSFLMIIS